MNDMNISRPFDLLNNAIGKPVLLKLKGNKQFRGKLQAFDQHMNVVLEEVDELEDGKKIETIGKALIRGDTIIYIAP
ncbi:MAG: hypothetical protein J4432_04990 [DPANN group archaeon]|nr:hypothetical protein [DPANN group archaeon]